MLSPGCSGLLPPLIHLLPSSSSNLKVVGRGKRPELIQKERGEILGPAQDDHDTTRQTTSRSKKAHKNWPASVRERVLLLANLPPFI